jgi:hypothetical protein
MADPGRLGVGVVSGPGADLGRLGAVGVGLALSALGAGPHVGAQFVTLASGLSAELRQHPLRVAACPLGLHAGRAGHPGYGHRLLGVGRAGRGPGLGDGQAAPLPPAVTLVCPRPFTRADSTAVTGWPAKLR